MRALFVLFVSVTVMFTRLNQGSGMLIFAAASMMFALLIGNILHEFEADPCLARVGWAGIT